MRHPIQRLYHSPSNSYLFVGVGGKIQVLSLQTGNVLGEGWEAPQKELPPINDAPVILGLKKGKGKRGGKGYGKEKEGEKEKKESANGNQNGNAPVQLPGGEGDGGAMDVDVNADEITAAGLPKKRKAGDITLSTPQPKQLLDEVDEGPSTPLEPGSKKTKVGEEEEQQQKQENGQVQAEVRRRKVQGGINCVTHIIGTASGRFLVAATNEDKTVRVFRVGNDAEGKLVVISERQVPKRLCTLRLIEKKANMTEEEETALDNVTIICADKFGDVYSFPLMSIPAPTDTPKPTSTSSTPIPAPASEEKPKPEYKIFGGGIITTERNKIAAKKAQKAANRDSLKKLESTKLPFQCKLLLGHVSLLIDVLPVTLDVDLPDGKRKQRAYILSADKDEHIRVSRYPDGHVIEGFCLAHTMYVSRLLVPEWDKRVLVSGGGDGFLLKWDWLKGKVVQKIELREYVMGALGAMRRNRETLRKRNGGMDVDVDVDIGEVKTGDQEEFHLCVIGIYAVSEPQKQILVTVESVPALFIFKDTEAQGYQYYSTVGVHGNILDLTIIDGGKQVWVSIDPQSTPYDISQDTKDVVIELLEPSAGTEEYAIHTGTSEVARNANVGLSWEVGPDTVEKLQEVLYCSRPYRKFEGESGGGEDAD